ncbi:MAG: biopolymer transporter ExbD [Gammaproteobacteria bacterium]|nr:biopolymer transporter ExbD [Gammaproteobacteria bacterium]
MKRFDQINVIPFIDVMLVLLAIILTTATFVAQGTIPVNLPVSQSATKSQNQNPVEITIDEQGIYFINSEPVHSDLLGYRLSQLSLDTTLLLRVDAKSDFGSFVFLAEKLKALGLKKVSILTRKQK